MTEFFDAARTMLEDLRRERARRKDQRKESIQTESQGALQRATWFQDAATDVLRRVRTIQNLSQAVSDWNLCAEERVRLREAENSENHINQQVMVLVDQKKIELEASWTHERSQLAHELAQVKSALWSQQVVGESMPRSPTAAGARHQSPRQSPRELGPDDRRKKLKAVFAAFDLDHSGSIEVNELLALGKARRSSGQRKGDWSAEQNQKLVKKLDSNYDGHVSEQEFVNHFNQALPRDIEQFDAVIHDFLEVAKVVRHKRAAVLAMEQSEAVSEAATVYQEGELEELKIVALDRAVSSVPYVDFVRPFLIAWRSKMKMEELMSPRSYAQKVSQYCLWLWFVE